MPAAPAIAPSAAPGPVKPGGPVQPTAAPGAGDLFAVLVGMGGEDKAAQPNTGPAPAAHPKRPQGRVEDKAETGASAEVAEGESQADADADSQTVADLPASAAPADTLIVAQAAAPAAAPTPVPAPQEAATAPAPAPAAPASATAAPGHTAKAEVAPLTLEAPAPTLGEHSGELARVDQGAPTAAPDLENLTTAPAPQAEIDAAPAPATKDRPPVVPPSATPSKAQPAETPAQTHSAPVHAPATPALQAAAAQATQPPAVESAPVSEPPPSIAAVVAGASQPAQGVGKPEAKSDTKGAFGKSVPGDSRLQAADPAAQGSGRPAVVAAEVAAGVSPDAASEPDLQIAQFEGGESPAPLDAEAPASTPTPSQAAPAAGTTAQAGATATAGTVSHLAAQIVQRLDGRATRFDVQLDPHGLGKVNVSVQIDARGRLSASMSFENPESADALKARAGDLRQALEQAGFDLSGSGLSFEGDFGSGFAREGWGERGQAGAHGRGRAFGAAAETLVQADLPPSRSGAQRGLDIRI